MRNYNFKKKERDFYSQSWRYLKEDKIIFSLYTPNSLSNQNHRYSPPQESSFHSHLQICMILKNHNRVTSICLSNKWNFKYIDLVNKRCRKMRDNVSNILWPGKPSWRYVEEKNNLFKIKITRKKWIIVVAVCIYLYLDILGYYSSVVHCSLQHNLPLLVEQGSNTCEFVFGILRHMTPNTGSMPTNLTTHRQLNEGHGILVNLVMMSLKL